MTPQAPCAEAQGELILFADDVASTSAVSGSCVGLRAPGPSPVWPPPAWFQQHLVPCLLLQYPAARVSGVIARTTNTSNTAIRIPMFCQTRQLSLRATLARVLATGHVSDLYSQKSVTCRTSPPIPSVDEAIRALALNFGGRILMAAASALSTAGLVMDSSAFTLPVACALGLRPFKVV